MMKKMKNKNITDIIILSITLTIFHFLYIPLEIFLTNSREFTLSLKYIAMPLIIFTLLACVIMLIFMYILRCINENVYLFFYLSFYGELIASYIQVLFFNGKMKSITGDAVNYNDLGLYLSINLEIFFLILICPIVLYKIKNKTKEYIKFVSLVVLVMCIAGFVGDYLQYNKIKDENETNLYMTYNLNLSNKENIIVFLMDRLDGEWMDELIDEYPELKTELKDFTFYEDNVSMYLHTFPAVPSMIFKDRYKYDKEDYEYIEEGWKGENIIRRLKENDYTVYLNIDKSTTYNNLGEIVDLCDNIKDENIKKKIHFFTIIKTMIDFSYGKTMPYALKEKFILDYDSSFSNDFLNYGNEVQKMRVGMDSDMDFYNYLTKEKIRNDINDKKVFSFMHFDCAHGISKEISMLYNKDIVSIDELTTARGEFVMVKEYIDQLKKLGIYDNSTIIIVSDHGRVPEEVQNYGGNLSSQITSTLIKKKKNETHDEIRIDNKTPMSHAYFAASILEYAGIKDDEYGKTYNDIINGDSDEKRYIYEKAFNGMYLEYEINGNCRDFSNWKRKE